MDISNELKKNANPNFQVLSDLFLVLATTMDFSLFDEGGIAFALFHVPAPERYVLRLMIGSALATTIPDQLYEGRLWSSVYSAFHH